MARRDRKRKAAPPPIQFGHLKADILIDTEVENPLYQKAHDGERWNPDKIPAARNLRESTFASLVGRKVIDIQQVMAARKFLGYYEAMGGSGAQAIDYSHEPVDGGGAREAISDRQVEAGIRLKEAREHLGNRPYLIVERIIGEGYTIAQISNGQRECKTNADYLKNALDDLCALWGINSQSNKPVKHRIRSLVIRTG